jgi:hypothetical protein
VQHPPDWHAALLEDALREALVSGRVDIASATADGLAEGARVQAGAERPEDSPDCGIENAQPHREVVGVVVHEQPVLVVRHPAPRRAVRAGDDLLLDREGALRAFRGGHQISLDDPVEGGSGFGGVEDHEDSERGLDSPEPR